MSTQLIFPGLSTPVPEPIGYWNFSQICDLSYQRKAIGNRSAYFLNESWLFANSSTGWQCRRAEYPRPRTYH